MPWKGVIMKGDPQWTWPIFRGQQIPIEEVWKIIMSEDDDHSEE